jgi:NAD(P)H-hydrate repair Nnr-like enzyme with NAD(P)H-hydrate dehydratase domain
VLAGLVAGLYATQDAVTSAVIASYVNKKAGEELAKTVGPYFNATDLAMQIPKCLAKLAATH